MQFGQPSSKRQPETSAFVFTGWTGIYLTKWLQGDVDLVRRHPQPVSRTSNATPMSVAWRLETSTDPPGLVNLMALEIRFSKIVRDIKPVPRARRFSRCRWWARYQQAPLRRMPGPRPAVS